MKHCYCWRCQFVVPMLDEREYADIHGLFVKCMQDIATVVRNAKETPPATSIYELMKPVRDAYESMSGWKDMHHNAIMHHRLALLGPDCVQCGKPLRTPRAKLCAACGRYRPV